MFKRVFLFLATNLAVLVLLGIVMSLLGINPQSSAGLLAMAALFGFGGSLISLLSSKWMAKRATGAQVIAEPRSEAERWLVQTVQRQAQAAGIGMPEVAIYEAPEINAFATGANRNKALVAVSTGLLQHMDRDEAEAVLGHEVGHVANGDMVTMALLQGVLNTFVIVLARVVGQIIGGALSGGRDNGGGIGFFLAVNVLQLVFGLFASMIAMWFSRQREFRADVAGATLASREKMIRALEKLKLNQGVSTLPERVEAFGIAGGAMPGAFKRMMMSHPPLEERIAALRNAQLDGDAVRQGVVA